MRSFLSKYKYQLILVITGLLWIALLNALLQIKAQGIIYPDSQSYLEAAGFMYHDFKAHYYRPLGMALVYGLPYLFGGTDAAVYEFSFIVNLLCWLGSALLVFGFLRKILTDNKALLFSFLFYSVLGSAFITFHLLTESLFMLLLLVAFRLLDAYYQKNSFHYLSLAMSLFILMMLVKPGAKFWAIVVIVYFGRQLIKNYRNRSTAFIWLSLGLVLFQCLKVKQEYGNFTISYIDAPTYYNYLGNQAQCLADGKTFAEGIKERSEYIFSFSFPEQKVVASKDMAEQLKGNTANLVKAYFLDIAENTKTPSDCINICTNLKGKSYFEPLKNVFIIISKYQNRFFTVIGVILALFYGVRLFTRPGIYTMMSLYILYTIALSGISSHQGDRFHIIFFPLVIILMGKFCADRIRKAALQHEQ